MKKVVILMSMLLIASCGQEQISTTGNDSDKKVTMDQLQISKDFDLSTRFDLMVDINPEGLSSNSRIVICYKGSDGLIDLEKCVLDGKLGENGVQDKLLISNSGVELVALIEDENSMMHEYEWSYDRDSETQSFTVK